MRVPGYTTLPDGRLKCDLCDQVIKPNNFGVYSHNSIHWKAGYGRFDGRWMQTEDIPRLELPPLRRIK